MSKELLKRSQVKKEDTWAIEDLYATDELWKVDYDKAKEAISHLAGFKGRLLKSADELFDFLQSNDNFQVLLNRLGNYSTRRKDEDTANPIYQAMAGEYSNLVVSATEALAFIEPEIIAIPEATMDSFYKEKEELLLYQRHINVIRSKKDHILSPAEERIMAAASDLSGIPSDIYGMMNNADVSFKTIINEEGVEERLTHGNFISFLHSSNRKVREDAFKGVYSFYQQFDHTLAATLYGQMKLLSFRAKMRHYNSCLEASLSNTEVPVSVYESLLTAVEEKLPLMHRYVALRKKILGYQDLHMYDLYTPIVPDMDVKIPYEEAVETILKALEPLGEEYLTILRKGFSERWIDRYENEGKRCGAYSAGARVHPYVLMNYAGTLDSMFTLAHEMGHAVHSYLSNHNQPVVYSDYVIFVAEVASTCNESLLMRYLLNHTEDQKKKAYLINHFMEKFRGTLFRQTMFAEFELKISRLMEAGQSLTAQLLSEVYHELNVKYYGESIVVDSEIDVEWARIPHFYYNFYVFQYATGYSAAIALSNKILNEGESAVKDYMKFLSGGSSMDPISLLKIAGVDMATSKPVKDALDLFEDLIDEFETLSKA